MFHSTQRKLRLRHCLGLTEGLADHSSRVTYPSGSSCQLDICTVQTPLFFFPWGQERDCEGGLRRLSPLPPVRLSPMAATIAVGLVVCASQVGLMGNNTARASGSYGERDGVGRR